MRQCDGAEDRKYLVRCSFIWEEAVIWFEMKSRSDELVVMLK